MATAHNVIIDGREIMVVDLPWGTVYFGYPGLNEMTILNTMPGDPPGLRFVSPDGNCGKWSFCVGDDVATAVELLLFQGKKDERTRGRNDLTWGEATIHVKGEADPNNPRDDGMRPVGLLLHDYVWFKGINGDAPVKPWVVLPPPPAPPPPPPEGPTPEQRAEWKKWADHIIAEFAPSGIEIDPKNVQAVLDGRTPPREFHDDLVQRLGYDPWSQQHPDGAPY